MENTTVSPNGTIEAESGQLSSLDILEILNDKLKAYLKLRYDTELDYGIAGRLNDEALKEQMLTKLKRIEEAIRFIEEEIAKQTGQ